MGAIEGDTPCMHPRYVAPKPKRRVRPGTWTFLAGYWTAVAFGFLFDLLGVGA